MEPYTHNRFPSSCEVCSAGAMIETLRADRDYVLADKIYAYYDALDVKLETLRDGSWTWRRIYPCDRKRA